LQLLELFFKFGKALHKRAFLLALVRLSLDLLVALFGILQSPWASLLWVVDLRFDEVFKRSKILFQIEDAVAQRK
jgi:hypothetical protein